MPPRFHLLRSIPPSVPLLAATILLIAHEDGDALRHAALWLAVLATLWEQREALRARPGLLVGGWSRAAILWLVVPLATVAAMTLAHRPNPLIAALEALKRLLPFALAWPPLALLLRDRARELHAAAPAARALQRWLWGALAAWAGWLLLVSILGVDPRTSFRFLYKESFSYLTLFAIFWLALTADRGAHAGRWLLWIAGVGAAVATADIVIGLLANLSPRLVLPGTVRIDYVPEIGRTIRVQFPFREHNRLASWLLVTVAVAPIASVMLGRGRGRIFAWTAAALAVIAIGFTGTRGALLAIVLGAAVLVLARPRWLLALLPLALIVFLLLPTALRPHVNNAFDLAAYRDPLSSISYRFTAWRVTPRMIADRPLTGLGYGWPIFEALYPAYNTEEIQFPTPHAHNLALQLAVETGIPGLIIFSLYIGGLFVGAVQLAFRHPRGSPLRQTGWAILVMLVILLGFGLTNYPLRRSVGAAVWMMYCSAHALLILSPLNSPARARES